MKALSILARSLGLTLLLVSSACSAEMGAFQTVLRISGTDEAKESKQFTVGPHWRVVCTSSKAGDDFGIQIFVIPTAGLSNAEVIDVREEGLRVVYFRNPGTYRVKVIGFSASWSVTVEDQPTEKQK